MLDGQIIDVLGAKDTLGVIIAIQQGARVGMYKIELAGDDVDTTCLGYAAA